MPNWCECDLFIQGPKAKVEEFLRLVQSEESPFDFNRLIPYPKRFRRLDAVAEGWDKAHPAPWTPEEHKSRPKDGYSQGGYEWCVRNWGTKWPAKDARVNEREGWRAEDGTEHVIVEVNFSTPWEPPRPVVERASELFPGPRFDLRYFDGGAGFNGRFVCENGDAVADERDRYFGNRGG